MIELNSPRRVLALQDRSRDSLSRSASGGAFPVLARPILTHGGRVYGACENERGVVAHRGIERLEEIDDLQGSKYVQSKSDGIYREIGALLKDGETVFFSGTPCQCYGLCAYLEEKGIIESLETADKLLVCDLICHGVPSNDLYIAYLDWLAKLVGAESGIGSFRFRSKEKGWGLYYEYSYTKKGRVRNVCEPCDDSPYYSAFLKGTIYRDSCYECPFARRKRAGDFTIGDYWGIETAHPDFPAADGASVVMLNTEKAVRYFDSECSDSCLWVESSFELASRENGNLSAPTSKPSYRAEVMKKMEEAYSSQDFSELFGKTLRTGSWAKRVLKGALPPWLLAFLKRLKAGMKGGCRDDR